METLFILDILANILTNIRLFLDFEEKKTYMPSQISWKNCHERNKNSELKNTFDHPISRSEGSHQKVYCMFTNFVRRNCIEFRKYCTNNYRVINTLLKNFHFN